MTGLAWLTGLALEASKRSTATQWFHIEARRCLECIKSLRRNNRVWRRVGGWWGWEWGGGGEGGSSLVVCWARCPAWCSVVGSILLWGEFFQKRRFFPWSSNGFWLHSRKKTSFGWEYKPRSSLCTHAFHCTDSEDPDIHVLDGWMPATKTHPVCTTYKDGMWLPLWLDKETVTYMYTKISPKMMNPRDVARRRRMVNPRDTAQGRRRRRMMNPR